MADHAEREQTRVGVNVNLMPWESLGVTLSYFRRDDDYPNRPCEVPGNAGTESGLLEAKYNTYTVDLDYTPSERVQLARSTRTRRARRPTSGSR